MKTVTLTLITRERSKADGKKFLTHTAQVSDKWVTVKFNSDVENAPRKVGKYTIKLNLKNVSIKSDGQYTTLWVNEIISLKKWTDEELKKEAVKKASDYFGDMVQDETDD